MRRLLVLLVAFASAGSWLPICVEPNLELPFWVALTCVALCTGLSVILIPTSWRLLSLATVLSTFFGLCFAFAIWPPRDPLAGSYVGLYVVVITAAALLLAFAAEAAVRWLSHSSARSRLSATSRRAVWVALLGCVAFGPLTLALTPPLVRHRIARNNRLAAERFASLKYAVETTKATDGTSQTCDGEALQRHYSGPRFSDTDWKRITGNYVKQDGYFFMVYCREKGGTGYTIAARPTREPDYGTREFCTDESRAVGCGTEWVDSRNKCLPCRKERYAAR